MALSARSTCHAVVLVLADDDREDERPPRRLSPRERQVLLFAGSGLTSGEAAAELGIRRNTVDSLVRSALAKLDERTRTQAAVLAAAGRAAGVPAGPRRRCNRGSRRSRPAPPARAARSGRPRLYRRSTAAAPPGRTLLRMTRSDGQMAPEETIDCCAS